MGPWEEYLCPPPPPPTRSLKVRLTALFCRFAYFVAFPRPTLFSGKGVSEHVQTAPTPFDVAESAGPIYLTFGRVL